MTYFEKLKSIALFITYNFLLYIGARRRELEAVRAVCENEKEKMPLKKMGSVEEVSNYVLNTRYNSDPFEGKLDYVNSAESMFYKIETFDYNKCKSGPYIGDCDDYAFLFGKLIVLVDGVKEVKHVSVTYRGGAHAITLFKQDGILKYFDYGIKNAKNLEEACRNVATRYSKDNSTTWLTAVTEDITAGNEFPGEWEVFLGD